MFLLKLTLQKGINLQLLHESQRILPLNIFQLISFFLIAYCLNKDLSKAGVIF